MFLKHYWPFMMGTNEDQWILLTKANNAENIPMS